MLINCRCKLEKCLTIFCRNGCGGTEDRRRRGSSSKARRALALLHGDGAREGLIENLDHAVIADLRLFAAHDHADQGLVIALHRSCEVEAGGMSVAGLEP